MAACPKCGKTFRVLEDEVAESCPRCGYDPQQAPACQDCGKPMEHNIDHNYGADRDGRRGIRVEWWECPECG